MQYTIMLFSPVISGFICLVLASLTYRRRLSLDARLALFFLLAMAVWSLAYAAELGSPSLEAKLAWTRIQYLGIATVPAIFLRFAIEYTYMADAPIGYFNRNRGRWNWIWLIPGITLALEWTDNYHQFIHTGAELEILNGFTQANFQYGPWFWVHVGYSYLALATATVLLLRAAWMGSSMARRQVLIILIGAFAPWIGNLIYLLDLPLLAGLDLTPIAFSISGVCMYIGIARYRLLDLTPIARAAILESMLNGVIVLDARGRIVEVNPSAQRALGKINAREINSLPLSQVWPEWDTLNDSAKEGVNFEFHQGAPAPAGRDFEVQVTALQRRPGERLGSLVILHDITESKHQANQQELLNRELGLALEAAQAASRAKSTFLANVGDELRTPLNAIIGLSQFIELNTSLDHDARTNIDIIKSNGARLLQMVDRVLKLVSLEAGSVELEIQSFEFPKLLADMELNFMQPALEKNIQLDFDCAPEIPGWVVSDQNRVKDILSTLIENALQFAPYSGQVQVRAWLNSPTPSDTELLNEPTQPLLNISVTDNGAGLAPQHLEQIFEPFALRGNSPALASIRLSLPVARQLARLLGGDVTVNSRLSQGSTFTLSLRLTQAS